MHIVLFGGNQLGLLTASHLAGAGHNVVVVDQAIEIFDEPRAPYPGFQLTGPLDSHDTWERAKLSEAQVVLALTNDFASNLMLAGVAKQHYHVSQVICLAEKPEQARLLNRLGVTAVLLSDILSQAIVNQVNVTSGRGETK